jgi:hypothetical protein
VIFGNSWVLACSSRTSLAAENLFRRKQLVFYMERRVKPQRLNNAARVTLVLLAWLLDWRQLLVVVRPETLVHPVAMGDSKVRESRIAGQYPIARPNA